MTIATTTTVEPSNCNPGIQTLPGFPRCQTFVYFGLFAREIEISLNELEPRDLTVDLILDEA